MYHLLSSYLFKKSAFLFGKTDYIFLSFLSFCFSSLSCFVPSKNDTAQVWYPIKMIPRKSDTSWEWYNASMKTRKNDTVQVWYRTRINRLKWCHASTVLYQAIVMPRENNAAQVWYQERMVPKKLVTAREWYCSSAHVWYRARMMPYKYDTAREWYRASMTPRVNGTKQVWCPQEWQFLSCTIWIRSESTVWKDSKELLAVFLLSHLALLYIEARTGNTALQTNTLPVNILTKFRSYTTCKNFDGKAANMNTFCWTLHLLVDFFKIRRSFPIRVF